MNQKSEEKSVVPTTGEIEHQREMEFWREHGEEVARSVALVLLVVAVCYWGSYIANQASGNENWSHDQTNSLSSILIHQGLLTNDFQHLKIPVETIVALRQTELKVALADKSMRCLTFLGIAGVCAWGAVRILRED